MQVTIHEAKTHLSRLIAAVERGEEVVIAWRDKPVVRLVAEKPEKPKRRLGALAHLKANLDGFFDPKLEEEITRHFDDAVDADKPYMSAKPKDGVRMRRYLLDTMTFLWMGFFPERLGREAVGVLDGTEGEFFYSMVNLWEIGIKMSRGGYRGFILPEDWERVIPETFDGMGMIRLPIEPVHCRLVQDLPFHHKDPFDRMLIAQALERGLEVIGADSAFDAYGVKRIW